MAWIEGTENTSLEVDATLEAVADFFCEPSQFLEAYALMETADEIEPNVWNWKLVEKREKGIVYQADYIVEYSRDGNTLTWSTRSGNMRSEGKTVVREQRGTVFVDYRETIATDLPIPKLAAKLFRPIVAREIRHGVSDFLERSKSLLESR